MADIFKKLENGKYQYNVNTRNWNPVFRDSALEYLNCLSPIFDKAKQQSEFEFIFTLLRFRGISEPGNVPFDNTIDIYEEVFSIQEKIKDSDKRLNLAFWAYAHWIEASEPYETIGNLLNIINGGRYHRTQFPKKKSGKYFREQYPHEKITTLETLANEVGHIDCLKPIKDIYDRELRNSIFHSDYNIYNQEMRSYKNFSDDETYSIINKTIAYFKVYKFLYETAIQEYEIPKLIAVPSYFNDNEFATTISRKGYGLVGIKDNYSKEDYENRVMPWHIVSLHGYELRMLKDDRTINQFPKDKVKAYNRIAKRTPRFIRKIFRKQIKKYQKKLLKW